MSVDEIARRYIAGDFPGLEGKSLPAALFELSMVYDLDRSVILKAIERAQDEAQARDYAELIA